MQTNEPPARILIVDDNLLNRKKISRAVVQLGHSTEVAEDGMTALQMLSQERFDAVLLDIVMPNMDGFEVLSGMARHDLLHDLPVIVISALEDERESVARAIELGAEDFLPKDFDLAVLKARLNSSLAKKRFRDQERQYFGRITRLTEAAKTLEDGRFNPDTLGLDDLIANNDPIGKLALVFRGMAAEIYQRELKLRQTVEKLQAILFVIAVGVIWGLTPSLGRLASELGSTSLGLVVWTNSFIAVVMLSLAALKGEFPRLTWRDLRFFISWAVFAGVGQRTAMFIASSHVEASLLAMILTLQGFFVFAIAAVIRSEPASLRRLIGLAVGLAGVAIVLITKFDLSSQGQLMWLGFSILIPLLLSLETLFFAAKRPTHVTPTAAVGLMMLCSALIIAPFATQRGELMPLSFALGQMELLIGLMVISSILSYLIAFHIIETAGPVFYSQSAYTMTIAGVIWGMLLLGEAFSSLAWAAFGVILIGMYLVDPRDNETELIVTRKFSS